MARPLRVQAAGLTYHVFSRGCGGMVIFRDDIDRIEFLRLLLECVRRDHVVCHAHCLMSTHYHLVLTTTEANLSRAIQHLNEVFARWWNRRVGRVGHVFQGRFGSSIVQDDAYLLTVSRYVVLNPVRSDLVESAEDWVWSSCRATAGLEPVPPFLWPNGLWRLLGTEDEGLGAQRYREFVAVREARFEKLPSGPVIGDAAFVERFKAVRARASHEVPRAERLTRPALETVFAGAVTRAIRNERAVLAHEQGYSMAEIARFLGVHYSTISRVVSSAERGQIVQNAAIQDLTPKE